MSNASRDSSYFRDFNQSLSTTCACWGVTHLSSMNDHEQIKVKYGSATMTIIKIDNNGLYLHIQGLRHTQLDIHTLLRLVDAIVSTPGCLFKGLTIYVPVTATNTGHYRLIEDNVKKLIVPGLGQRRVVQLKYGVSILNKDDRNLIYVDQLTENSYDTD